MGRKNWVKEREEIFDLVLQGVEDELDLPDRVRTYVLLRELAFWCKVREEAERRIASIKELLPEKARLIWERSCGRS